MNKVRRIWRRNSERTAVEKPIQLKKLPWTAGLDGSRKDTISAGSGAGEALLIPSSSPADRVMLLTSSAAIRGVESKSIIPSVQSHADRERGRMPLA